MFEQKTRLFIFEKKKEKNRNLRRFSWDCRRKKISLKVVLQLGAISYIQLQKLSMKHYQRITK